MPNIDGTTRAQTNFLRRLRDNPALPASQWPTAFLFRKWLRRPGFRRAMLALRDTTRFQSAYHLAQTGTRAATCLHAYLHFPDEYQLDADQLNTLFTILRLSHAAQRFDPRAKPAATPTPAATTPDPLIQSARDLHRDLHSVSDAPPAAMAPSA